MNHYLFLGCSYEPVLLLRKLVLIFRFFFAIFLALNVNTVFVMLLIIWLHCVESARIQIYSGPHFPAFGQNTKRYGESLCIQSECRKMQTRITPNMNTFHSVLFCHIKYLTNTEIYVFNIWLKQLTKQAFDMLQTQALHIKWIILPKQFTISFLKDFLKNIF